MASPPGGVVGGGWCWKNAKYAPRPDPSSSSSSNATRTVYQPCQRLGVGAAEGANGPGAIAGVVAASVLWATPAGEETRAASVTFPEDDQAGAEAASVGPALLTASGETGERLVSGGVEEPPMPGCINGIPMWVGIPSRAGG